MINENHAAAASSSHIHIHKYIYRQRTIHSRNLSWMRTNVFHLSLATLKINFGLFTHICLTCKNYVINHSPCQLFVPELMMLSDICKSFAFRWSDEHELAMLNELVGWIIKLIFLTQRAIKVHTHFCCKTFCDHLTSTAVHLESIEIGSRVRKKRTWYIERILSILH